MHAVLWRGKLLRAFNDEDAASEWCVGDEQEVVPVVVVAQPTWERMVALAEKHFSTDLYAAGDHNEFWGLINAAEENQ